MVDLAKTALTVQQILALTNVGGQLITVGLATALSIKAAFKALAPQVTDEDLNAIVADARLRAQQGMSIADREIAEAQALIAAQEGQ